MSEPIAPLALPQINIVVRDMKRSLAFYRLLGVSIEDTRGPEWTEWARHHVNGVASNGVRVEFDSVAFAKQWNPGLDEAKLGSAVIPIFHVASREEVDRVHARVTAAGHRSHKAPEDAFWGARYAIVEDPDGELGRHHERDRRVPAPAAAASASHLIASTDVATALSALFNIRSKEKGAEARGNAR